MPTRLAAGFGPEAVRPAAPRRRGSPQRSVTLLVALDARRSSSVDPPSCAAMKPLRFGAGGPALHGRAGPPARIQPSGCNPPRHGRRRTIGMASDWTLAPNEIAEGRRPGPPPDRALRRVLLLVRIGEERNRGRVQQVERRCPGAACGQFLSDRGGPARQPAQLVAGAVAGDAVAAAARPAGADGQHPDARLKRIQLVKREAWQAPPELAEGQGDQGISAPGVAPDAGGSVRHRISSFQARRNEQEIRQALQTILTMASLLVSVRGGRGAGNPGTLSPIPRTIALRQVYPIGLFPTSAETRFGEADIRFSLPNRRFVQCLAGTSLAPGPRRPRSGGGRRRAGGCVG